MLVTLPVITAFAHPIFWLLVLLPLGFVYWTLQTKTVVGEDGITVQPAVGKPTHTPWEQIAAVGFPRGKTYAQVKTTEDTTFSLPAVTFASIPALSRASQGRIPDVLSEAQRALSQQVRVINRDGYDVVVDPENPEDTPLAEGEEITDLAASEHAGETHPRRDTTLEP